MTATWSLPCTVFEHSQALMWSPPAALVKSIQPASAFFSVAEISLAAARRLWLERGCPSDAEERSTLLEHALDHARAHA